MDTFVKENKMGTSPILKLIVTMAPPAMFSMLVQALYNIVDSYYVAKLSENALTAVSLAFPIQNLMIAFAIGTAVGVSSLIARRLGEKRQDEANSAAAHGVIFSILSSLLFVAFGFFFTRPFFALFTNDLDLIGLGTEYLSICCIFSFTIFIEICCEKILQSTGNMFWPMIFQLCGAVTNIILDPILIFGYFGFPKMGIRGAAIATIIGQFVAMVVCIIVLVKKDHDVHVTFKKFKFSPQITKEIYIVGVPQIIMQAIGTVMLMALNGILATFSTVAITVLGVYFKLQSFVFMPLFGLTQGLMPIIGYNYGARKKKRMTTTVRYGLIIGLIMNLLGTLMFLLIPEQLLSIFNASDELLQIGVPALRIISVVFIPASVSIILSTTFQAVGRGMYSMVISILRQLVALVPAAWLLAKISLQAVWFAFPIAELFSFSLCIIFFIHLYRTEIKNLETAQLR